MRPTALPMPGLAGWLAASLVLIGTVLAVGGVAAGTDAGGPLQVAQPTPGNETTRHEDPRAVDDDGDLGALRGWLAGRMAVQLEDCVVGVGAGTADVCELGGDYPEWLRKYVDVAEDTDDEADDEAGEAFDAATEQADDYAASVAEFRRTHEAYREARDEGDGERARALARELQRQGSAVEAAGDDLLGTFAVIEGGTGVDLSDARDSVNETRRDVSMTVEAVEREQFEATALTAELVSRTVSFVDPGTLRGRLTTASGTPVADRRIRLAVGDQVLETETDGTGRFAVTYRPTTLERSAAELPVRYRPRDASPYLASETTVPLAVDPVGPTVDVAVTPATVRYGDSLAVSGRVAAGGVGAPDVPVVVSLDGRPIGRVVTDAAGRFSLSAPVAATDGPGAVTVNATYPLEGRALRTATGTSSLTVARTATTLEVAAAGDGPRGLVVEGSLRTAGGAPLPDQPVTVRVDGTPVDTLRTGPTGAFEGPVTVPSAVADGASVTAEVAFTGAGTNLEPANATATVELPPGDGAGSNGGDGPAGILERVGGGASEPGGWLPGSPLVALVAVGGLLAAGLGYVLWRRRWGPGPGDPDGVGAADRPAQPAPAGRPGSSLDAARERMPTDPDGAVLLAYGAVRSGLADRGRQADTHWEFLAACRGDGLDPGAVEALTRLTEAYERAAFAPAAVTEADATVAIERAAVLVD